MHLVSISSWVSPTHANSAIQALTDVSYTTSVQHKDVSHAYDNKRTWQTPLSLCSIRYQEVLSLRIKHCIESRQI